MRQHIKMEPDNLAKSVFVTVGTTSFDRLIEAVTEKSALKLFKQKGYSHIDLQIGRGEFIPSTEGIPGLTVSYFRYKDSLADSFRDCDLAISHAGAGSCLEALEAKKPLVVVINEDLMGNHQVELAHQLQKDGHLIYCNCTQFEETIRNLNTEDLLPFEPGKPEKFVLFLDKVMGVA